MKKNDKNLKKGQSPKVPILENLAAKKRLEKVAKPLSKASVDMKQVNTLVNTSIAYLQRVMEGRATKDIKRQIALEVTKKAMPKDIVVSDGEKGQSFISLVKELHKGEK